MCFSSNAPQVPDTRQHPRHDESRRSAQRGSVELWGIHCYASCDARPKSIYSKWAVGIGSTAARTTGTTEARRNPKRDE